MSGKDAIRTGGMIMIPLESNVIDFALGDFSKSVYVERARQLVPLLRERSRKQWQTNRVLDETAELLHEGEFFRMLQPRRFGGGETSPIEWLETMSTLAEGDPSVAWATGVLGIHSFHLSHFSDEAQTEVWGKNPRALLSSPYAPNPVQRVDGGFKLSGVWKFASGVHLCDYALVGGAVYDEGLSATTNRIQTGDYRAFMVSRSQFDIEENWDVHGMRGTGSHNIVIRDQFVPEYKTLEFRLVNAGETPGKRANSGILYQLPFWQVLGRITTSPVPLGALKGMVEQFCEIARDRVTLRGLRTAEDPVAAQAIATALAMVDEVKGNCYRNLGRLMKAVASGNTLPFDERQMFRYQTSSATFRVAELAISIYKACGASGIYESVPFGRYLNDILAVTGHVSNNSQVYANVWAGGLMGLDISKADLRA
jgi:3-hydroxy-9,10-secoandrosta-1,3,5(10)-triene-9,17-dione monooxygenase